MSRSPFPEELLPGLFRIPVPLPGNPLKELNAYLLRGAQRSVLVDTGFRQSACREALFAGLEALGCLDKPIDVVLTHLHSDHSGLAPEVAGTAGIIYVSRVDRPSLDDPEARRAFWGMAERRFLEEGFPPLSLRHLNDTNPARSLAPPTGGHYESLEDGQLLELGPWRLRCLLMPGHTPGQMCFFLEEHNAILLGDHVLFDITPNITAWPAMPDALGSYLASLERVRAYGGALPLPGHRGRGDLTARVGQLTAHHQCRLEEAFAAVRDHPGAGAYTLAGYMSWKIRAASWAEFPETQKWFAVGECMSHLDHLAALGRIERRTADGRAAYFARS